MIHLRYIGLVPVVFGTAGSVLMSVVGAGKTVKAFRIYFLGESFSETTPAPAYLDAGEQAMIYVVQGVDAFLISIALLVFAVGTYSLLIGEVKGAQDRPGLEVFNVRSISHLKQVLMEVIMVVLAVFFLSELMLFEGQEIYWSALVVPITIALIALSLKWVGWKR